MSESRLGPGTSAAESGSGADSGGSLNAWQARGFNPLLKQPGERNHRAIAAKWLPDPLPGAMHAPHRRYAACGVVRCGKVRIGSPQHLVLGVFYCPRWSSSPFPMPFRTPGRAPGAFGGACRASLRFSNTVQSE